MQLAKELFLVHDRVDATFRNDACLRHLLHRKEFLLFAQLNFPDLTESTSSNDIAKVEMIFVDF